MFCFSRRGVYASRFEYRQCQRPIPIPTNCIVFVGHFGDADIYSWLLAFVRLYYFERHFDNIKERSLMDYRMRKSATLARLGSAPTMSSTRLNTFNNQVLGFQERGREGFVFISSVIFITNKPAGSDSLQ